MARALRDGILNPSLSPWELLGRACGLTRSDVGTHLTRLIICSDNTYKPSMLLVQDDSCTCGR